MSMSQLHELLAKARCRRDRSLFCCVCRYLRYDEHILTLELVWKLFGVVPAIPRLPFYSQKHEAVKDRSTVALPSLELGAAVLIYGDRATRRSRCS